MAAFWRLRSETEICFGVFLSCSSMKSATKNRAEIILRLSLPFSRVRRDRSRQRRPEPQRLLDERLPAGHTTAERASHSVDVRGAGVSAVLAALGRFVHVSKENHDSCRVCGRILLTDVESFPVSEVLINPRASALGSVNAILNGRSTRHHESQFAGPLSIKTVIAGSATWETGEGRFELVPGTVLLLNDGEEYTVTVDALQP